MPPPLPGHVRRPTAGREQLFLYSTPVVAAVVSVVIIGTVLALLPRRHSPAVVADSAIAVAAAEQPARDSSPVAEAPAAKMLPPVEAPAVKDQPVELPPPPLQPVIEAQVQPNPAACKADIPAQAALSGGRYGTQVDFLDDPAAAAKQALKDKKLLFVLHIAGNFEEAGFT